MKFNRLSRRMFLQGSGSTLMAIPVLPSLLPRETWAQTVTVPKRFISVLTAYEAGHTSAWVPSLGTSVTNLSQPNRSLTVPAGHQPVRHQPLAEFTAGGRALAPLYGTALNPYVSNINILRGLDEAIGGHGNGGSLGARTTHIGWPSTNVPLVPTLDAVLANNRNINPNGRYVFAGWHGGGDQINEGFSFNLSGRPSTVISSATELYNVLFNNGTYPEQSGGGQVPQPTAHPRRDLLSRVLEDYNRLLNSRNISAVDRTALTNAMDKMSDVHRSLAGIVQVPGGTCSHRGITRPGGNLAYALSDANLAKAMVDMVVASIMCDSNRIFTLGFEMAYERYSGYTGGSDVIGSSVDFHNTVSHEPHAMRGGMSNWQWVVNHQKYAISRMFAPIVAALSGAIDPSNGMSYLHNSLVLCSFEANLGHGWASKPAILAGRAGGAISSGNYLDYSDRTRGVLSNNDGGYSTDPTSPQFTNNYAGTHYNRLLVTILRAMGMTPAQYENDALNVQVYNRTDIGAQNRNLTSVGGFSYVFPTDRNLESYSFTNHLPHLDLAQFRNPLPMP